MQGIGILPALDSGKQHSYWTTSIRVQHVIRQVSWTPARTISYRLYFIASVWLLSVIYSKESMKINQKYVYFQCTKLTKLFFFSSALLAWPANEGMQSWKRPERHLFMIDQDCDLIRSTALLFFSEPIRPAGINTDKM